jgi:predicted hotdog family 3-hydroxylacyl-ACP dehydratase
MNPTEFLIKDLLPHRNRMLLVERILEANEALSVSSAVVADHWPLVCSGSASPIVMVELAAQTAGINNSINRLQTRGKEDGNMGWIAGVKSAVFHISSLPVGATLITRTQNKFAFEDFREVTATVTLNKIVAAEITLQLVSA